MLSFVTVTMRVQMLNVLISIGFSILIWIQYRLLTGLRSITQNVLVFLELNENSNTFHLSENTEKRFSLNFIHVTYIKKS